MIFDRGYRKIIGIDKVSVEQSKLQQKSLCGLSNLSLSFPIFLVNRDHLRICQNYLSVHLILRSGYLPLLQSMMRASSCILSAFSTVKHVMITMTLDCSHRFMQPLKNLKLSMHVTLLCRGPYDFTNKS